jgi:flagellar basal-body rod modification protein FlgD
VQVRITDSTGAVVREITLPNTQGTQRFTWDGLRNDGTAAAGDTYDIEAIASAGGQNGSLELLMAGRVSSVSVDASGTNLTLNTSTLGGVSMTDVRRVM